MRTVVLLLDSDPIISTDFLQEMQSRNIIIKTFSLESVTGIIEEHALDNVIFTMEISSKKEIPLITLLQREIECFTTIVRLLPENKSDAFKLSNLVKADYFVYHQLGWAELVIRLDAILSRMKLTFPREEVVRIGNYIYYVSTCTLVSPSGKTEVLTEKEAGILKLIYQERGEEIIDYNMVLKSLWGTANLQTKRTLHVFLFYLRKKLSEDESISLKIMKGSGIVFQILNAGSSKQSSDKIPSQKVMLNKRNMDPVPIKLK